MPALFQGYFFVFSAYCSFAQHFAGSTAPAAVYFPLPSSSLINAVRILFEVSFPISFVVSSLVTFVLIPHAKRANFPIDNFFVIIPLLMHNANITFMAIELIINKIPFVLWHFPFIMLYGVGYGVFSWIWNHFNGYYFYFFLDYTRPGAILWYMALMAIVSVFYLIGYASSRVMSSTESMLPSLVGRLCSSPAHNVN
jgi:hypothetical protein